MQNLDETGVAWRHVVGVKVKTTHNTHGPTEPHIHTNACMRHAAARSVVTG